MYIYEWNYMIFCLLVVGFDPVKLAQFSGHTHALILRELLHQTVGAGVADDGTGTFVDNHSSTWTGVLFQGIEAILLICSYPFILKMVKCIL